METVATMEFNKKEYQILLERIFEMHPSVQTRGFGSGAYKPGLEGMQAFDKTLGSPWKSYKSIHVAGTNGKGSVSSMLAAAIAARGYSVGLYTSPHLVDFRERMRIVSEGHWELISEEEVWDFLNTNPLDGLSFFEITTGMAFSWFARRNVDVAVIETGLGGRLDSTNIIIPELSIVTSIGLDHCALLGDSPEKIAFEKAGIFKSGVPALVGLRAQATEPVFENIARERHSPLFFADDFEFGDLETWKLDLEGPYQTMNLRTALAALELLGIGAEKEALCRAAAITGFRGRWERLMTEPEVICDIGHNPAALEINFRRLEESGRPLFIVYGVMADKDYPEVRRLMPAHARYFIASPGSTRALGVEKLAEVMNGLDFVTCSSVARAVRMAIEEATKVPQSLVYIGGSNFVVSECLIELDL